MIKFTENTLLELRRLAARGVPEDAVVRLGLKPGGCSGTTYVLEFEEHPAPRDLTFEQGEFTVVVTPDAAPLLEGLEVDFVDSLVGGGFRFRNPNAARTCGCGSSFQVEKRAAELR